MTTAAWGLLAAAAVFAVGNWIAVDRGHRRLEWVCKPATLALLIGVAVALDPTDGAQRAWFLAALVLSLAGDVFLMLPKERFVEGLAAFLLGHVAYIVGLGHEAALVPLVVGAAVVSVVTAVVGRRILASVQASDEPDLVAPVAAYMAVISAMVATAVGTLEAVAIAGAALFFLSDALIAWNRFVEPVPRARLAIMVTYHLGQAGLVLSLVR